MSDLTDTTSADSVLDRCVTLAIDHAEVLRIRAARLGGASETCAWAGPASRAFRADAHDACSRLRAAAASLEDVADDLRGLRAHR